MNLLLLPKRSGERDAARVSASASDVAVPAGLVIVQLVLTEVGETAIGLTLVAGALLWLWRPSSRITGYGALAAAAALLGAAINGGKRSGTFAGAFGSGTRVGGPGGAIGCSSTALSRSWPGSTWSLSCPHARFSRRPSHRFWASPPVPRETTSWATGSYSGPGGLQTHGGLQSATWPQAGTPVPPNLRSCSECGTYCYFPD